MNKSRRNDGVSAPRCPYASLLEDNGGGGEGVVDVIDIVDHHSGVIQGVQILVAIALGDVEIRPRGVDQPANCFISLSPTSPHLLSVLRIADNHTRTVAISHGIRCDGGDGNGCSESCFQECEMEGVLIGAVIVAVFGLLIGLEQRKKKKYREMFVEAADLLGLTYEQGGPEKRARNCMKGNIEGRSVNVWQTKPRKKRSSRNSSRSSRNQPKRRFKYEISLDEDWDDQVRLSTPSRAGSFFDVAKKVVNTATDKFGGDEESSKLELEGTAMTLNIEGPEDSKSMRRLRDEKVHPVIVDVTRKSNPFELGSSILKGRFRKRPDDAQELATTVEELVRNLELIEGQRDDVDARIEAFEPEPLDEKEKSMMQMFEAMEEMKENRG